MPAEEGVVSVVQSTRISHRCSKPRARQPPIIFTSQHLLLHHPAETPNAPVTSARNPPPQAKHPGAHHPEQHRHPKQRCRTTPHPLHSSPAACIPPSLFAFLTLCMPPLVRAFLLPLCVHFSPSARPPLCAFLLPRCVRSSPSACLPLCVHSSLSVCVPHPRHASLCVHTSPSVCVSHPRHASPAACPPQARAYLNKLPARLSPEDLILVTDPMLATGGTMVQVGGPGAQHCGLYEVVSPRGMVSMGWTVGAAGGCCGVMASTTGTVPFWTPTHAVQSVWRR